MVFEVKKFLNRVSFLSVLAQCSEWPSRDEISALHVFSFLSFVSL